MWCTNRRMFYCIVFLISILLINVHAEYNMETKLPDSSTSNFDGRAFFASDHCYSREGLGIDRVVIYGGVRNDGKYSDWDGTVWSHSISENSGGFNPLQADIWTEVPVPRAHHAGVAWAHWVNVISYDHGDNELPRNAMYFMIHGGKLAYNSDPTSEMWAFCEYYIEINKKKPNGEDEKYRNIPHYRWTTVTQEGNTPCARYDHNMIFFRDSEDNPKIFLAGGYDENGEVLDDAYIGVLSEDPVTENLENPWNFTLHIKCTWEKISDMAVGLAGFSMVYDPYYGPNEKPRAILYGGELDDGSLNDTLYSCDISDPEPDWIPLEIQGNSPPDRKFHAATLDVREHRMLIHGGDGFDNQNNPFILDDFWALNFHDNSSPTWEELDPGDLPGLEGHQMHYDWTHIFCGKDSSGECHNSIYRYIGEPKEWIVTKDAIWGMDDPQTIVNTNRIKKDDIVRIVASSDFDCFKVKLKVQEWVKSFTIEGDSWNESKPVLYTDYTPLNQLNLIPMEGCGTCENRDPQELEDYLQEATKSIVITDRSGLTIKNIRICHFDWPGGPGIPETRLELLADYTQDGRISGTFINFDTGIFTAAPTTIENCEFIGNGVGICNICVSSGVAINARVIGNVFYRNFIGCTPLETPHVIRGNEFIENYLAGIMPDKGSHAQIFDNLFINNGMLEDANDDWRSAILSNESVVDYTPQIQMPMIYNNTFYDNYRALSIGSHESNGQWLSMPIFFYNIIDNEGAASAIHFVNINLSPATWFISRHNCYHATRVFPDPPDFYSSLQSVSDIFDDPLFEDTYDGDFRLQSSSPCIDVPGFYNTYSGTISEAGMWDFNQLDIGYHFWDQTSLIGPVTNLHAVYEQDVSIEWDIPAYGSEEVFGYLIFWQDRYGRYLGQGFNYESQEYTIDDSLLGEGNVFGVVAFSDLGVFGTPEFIEM